MAWEVIYRRWNYRDGWEPDSFVAKATEGVDGVDELYVRGDGFVEIRMTDPEEHTYYIPLGQVLAYYSVDDEHVGEEL